MWTLKGFNEPRINPLVTSSYQFDGSSRAKVRVREWRETVFIEDEELTRKKEKEKRLSSTGSNSFRVYFFSTSPFGSNNLSYVNSFGRLPPVIFSLCPNHFRILRFTRSNKHLMFPYLSFCIPVAHQICETHPKAPLKNSKWNDHFLLVSLFSVSMTRIRM